MLKWLQYAQLSDEELLRHPLEEYHLACAVGAPGAEGMDVAMCLNRVAELSVLVERETRRYEPHFRQFPEKYRHSEAYFRVLVLITVLQRDCGIRYNPEKIHAHRFDLWDDFLVGIVQGGGGTCATLPVLYVSIGRRLGYPMKLVRCDMHLFARWIANDGEQFNIDGSGQGLSIHSDDHYREGRFSQTKKFEDFAGLMRPLVPRRELAAFLTCRAMAWTREGRHREAVSCLAWAAELDGFPSMIQGLEMALFIWSRELDANKPNNMPPLKIVYPPRRFRGIPHRIEQKMIELGIFQDRLAAPIRARQWVPLPHLPPFHRRPMRPERGRITQVTVQLNNPCEFDDSPHHPRNGGR